MYENAWALVKNGYVVNTVVWAADDGGFSEFLTVQFTEKVQPNIGDAYIDGVLYPKPRDRYDYTFDTEKLVWNLTADSASKKAKDDAASQLLMAQEEYNRASDKITALQQRMDDDDYDDTNTEDTVKAQKATWTTYRKALRAYISAADGTKSLPTAPDA
ncbi:hypothetical protein LU631_02820 [Erwinia tracheiphila]|uniref:hypothetical protein n=1 Tax=Erwinia tracheiphila TaxID=65700 RepID=UPI0003364074|nr:hypothetical protein [Erwinia tracheiphila]EOS94765.1 hypothetical protein ETR_11963 [Erwinia tracheiphila PSU-1]UIA88381.1 hypothetical protein LU631_02820 [Erwinia tracheiphila]UIA96198.1 hypothetical protein LU633_23340 [Erwinia tracheiphila]